ncbi:MAG: thiamine-phosphate kinase [Nitrospira sp.]|nr:thiamine-phosphate kinase [Nitrospira sp.]
MRLSKIGEFGLINNLRSRCKSSSPDILIGIGDDAAAIKPVRGKSLFTSDILIEDTHFDLSLTTFYQLGWKFLAINISDILAMGGRPDYFIAGLGIPDACRSGDIDELYSGILDMARKFNVKIIGGDTCSSKHGLILSGTLIGSGNKVITRSNAKAGDAIFITSTLGDSALGLELLKKGGKKVLSFSGFTPRLKLIKRHLMPEPRPLKNVSRITSMIDTSDGLLIDLGHICDESNTGALIYRDKIPVSPALATAAKKMGNDPLEFALKGGEDYALLFTAPKNIRTKAFRIGEITRTGRYIIDADGNKTPFKAEGYEHFKKK